MCEGLSTYVEYITGAEPVAAAPEGYVCCCLQYTMY